MSGLLKLLKAEPVATTAVVTAALGVATFFGLDQKLAGLLAGLIAALLAFPVRSGVTPMPHLVQVTNVAADAAAKGVAERLTSATVGNKGEITGAALGIATEVAGDAATAALRGIGLTRDDSKK